MLLCSSLAVILNPSDFDYLLTKGSSNVNVDRSSLLLRFDPLLGVPVPVNQSEQQQQKLQQVLGQDNSYKNTALAQTVIVEEDLPQTANNKKASLNTTTCAAVGEERQSFGTIKVRALEQLQELSFSSKQETAKSAVDAVSRRWIILKQHLQQIWNYFFKFMQTNANMSVDIIQDVNIDNDTNKAIITNSQ